MFQIFHKNVKYYNVNIYNFIQIGIHFDKILDLK
jgi:hypothetical protein